MRSVVKARFVKGKRGAAKMCAHIDYIQYRGGHDKKPRDHRDIFDGSKNRVSSDEVKENIRAVQDQSLQKNPVIAHKLILSPGLNAVNLQDYTRELMDKLGSEKGLDLKWYAVKHENTDNNHAHVVVLGRDQNGVEVIITRRDLDRIRDLGDRYIEREHYLERMLQRESDRVLGRDERYERQGDYEFQRLVGEVYKKRDDPEPDRSEKGALREKSIEAELSDSLSRPSRKRKYLAWSKDREVEKLPEDEKIVVNGKTYSKYSSSEDLQDLDQYLKSDRANYIEKEEYGMLGSWRMSKELHGDNCYEKSARYRHDKKFNKGFDKDGNAVRNIEEHRLLDKELRRTFNSSDTRYQKISRQEYRYISQGRLTAEHVHYSSIQNIARLEDLKERFPDRAQEFEAEIAATRKHDVEQLKERGWESFDELVNGKPADRAKGRRLGDDREEKGQGGEGGHEQKDLSHETHENHESNDRDSKENDLNKENRDGRQGKETSEKVLPETGKEIDRVDRSRRGQSQAKDSTGNQDQAAGNTEARNSMEAHGRVEGIQQDQNRDDKEQDRGDDDSDMGRGR